MAERDDDLSAPSGPSTLAGLWLKTPSTRRVQPSGKATTSPSKVMPDGSQLGLAFSEPGPVAKPRRAVQTGKPKPQPPRALAPERRVWTVRDLVTDIRQHVETGYADLWVQGEISDCHPGSSGHIYFTLKDGDAQLTVVLFRRQALLLRFRPQDGLAVFVRGRISVYESRGQLQLIADTMEPRGAGALQLAYEQLKARLLAEGLFDASRKRALPTFPRSIGIITSTSGAVLHDIRNVIRRRHSCLNLLIYPAAMQGPGSASAVADGIRWFNRHPEQVDLILIARGGGSLEDLAAFNEESLARAIAASELPTVSGIGHETDFTIADFVADLRAPTPSAAAELITAAQHRIEEHVEQLVLRLHRSIRYQLILVRQRFTALSTPQVLTRTRDLIGRRMQRLDDLRYRIEASAALRLRTPVTRLTALVSRLGRHNPTTQTGMVRHRIDQAQRSLASAVAAAIARRRSRLQHGSARLEALSPLAVLNRGYALVYAADGTILRDSRGVISGQTIRARLASGSFAAEVITTRDAS